MVWCGQVAEGESEVKRKEPDYANKRDKLPEAPPGVDPVWHAQTWDRWWDVRRGIGFRQLLAEQHAAIRRCGIAGLDFYARDPREDLRERARLGYKGRVTDEREITSRMVGGVSAYAIEHLLYRERVMFSKDHGGADLEKTFKAFFELGKERFRLKSSGEPGIGGLGPSHKSRGIGR